MSDGAWALINVGIGMVCLVAIYITYFFANRKYK